MQCYEVGTEVVVAALIYIDRLLSRNSDLLITEITAKSLLHTALTLATKFLMDRYEKNTIFYAVGGLTKRQMKNMSNYYLDLIDFDLFIPESEYSFYLSKLKTMIAYKYHQTGQIVILERNLRKKTSNLKVQEEEQRACNTLNERTSSKGSRLTLEGSFIKKQNTSSSLNDEEKSSQSEP